MNTTDLKQLSRLEAENLALRRLYDGMTRFMADSDMLWRDLLNIYDRVTLELEGNDEPDRYA